MFAENCKLVGEYTRMISEDATRSRFDDLDHRNHDIEEASSGGRDMTRVTSRDRVSRMLILAGKSVAINAPFGLGADWLDAKIYRSVRNHLSTEHNYLHFRQREKRIL